MREAKQIFSFETPKRRKRTARRKNNLIGRLQAAFFSAVKWLRSHQLARAPRKLKLLESVPLGEKRFAAVLEYEGQRFLIGGAAQSVQLLTTLQLSPFQNALAVKQTSIPESD
jgi:flagellar biogenesis protein FliO